MGLIRQEDTNEGNLMTYTAIRLPSFDDSTAKYKSLEKRILKRLDFIVQNPYTCAGSKLLGQGEWRSLEGLRSAYMQGSHFVLLFAICEECISSGTDEKNRKYCGTICDRQAHKRVVFVAFSTHDRAYGKL